MNKTKQALVILKRIRAIDKKLIALKGIARRKMLQKKHELVMLYVHELGGKIQ